ncbi:MAG: outer membrane lipoprotein carrier protein LolA [Desulfovibrio sp.]|nr:outer membrane lipoprotein carrier protein LolA [Desulfovibrio sp.]
MRSIVCVFLLLLLAHALLMQCAAAAEMAQNSETVAAQMLHRVAQYSSQIRTLRAEFVQEKRMSLLSRPLTSNGYFCLKRKGDSTERHEKHALGDSLLWGYTHPLASGFIFKNGQGAFWDGSPDNCRPADKEGRMLMTAVLRHMIEWVRLNPAMLQSSYHIICPDSNIPELHLYPLRQSLFSKMEVLFSADFSRVLRLTFVESNGDSVRISFKNIYLNEPLPDHCNTYLLQDTVGD